MRALLCEAALPDPDGSGHWLYICDRPATEVWRYGCVHEHVRERSTCDLHRPAIDEVGCQTCWNLGHNCPMSFQLVTA